MRWAGWLADAIVTIHAAYVAFVVFGMAAILTGLVLRWKWVRNAWFRGLHLAAIGVVVLESAFGIACPLTTWERSLRQRAGQATYEGHFLAHAMHRAIFFDAPSWVLTLLYILFGAGVLLAFLLAPPRWQWPRTGGPRNPRQGDDEAATRANI